MFNRTLECLAKVWSMCSSIENQPDPEQLYRRRHNLCFNLLLDLTMLEESLKTAKKEVSRWQLNAQNSELPVDVRNYVDARLSTARAELCLLESRITQTQDDLTAAGKKLDESREEMHQLACRIEDYRYARQRLAVVLA